jgi:ZIP family zinc transporter
MIEALLYGALAGAMIPVGGWIASHERIHPDWLEAEFRHFAIAFGAGALLAAVTLVLVPDGAEVLSPTVTILAFAAGGGAFALLDRQITLKTGPHGQLVAMLSDFVPEAIALGALLALGGEGALLLALLIGLQNLPEGFNAFREMSLHDTRRPRRILTRFCALAVAGPAAALIGHLYLGSYPEVLGTLMVFAGGGILYLMFQDIAPQAPLDNAWAPPLGAIAGFALGLAGDLFLG